MAISVYVIPWYGMTMGWLYTFTLGKPWAWHAAYTILSVAMVLLSPLFFVMLI